MKFWLKRSVPILLLVVSAATIAACDETLEGGLGCGVLCPEQPAALVQDTLEVVEMDTTVPGYPSTGAELQLLLARRGDTLDARGIIRFDSLPTVFRHANSVVDSSIVDVDSAMLMLRLAGIDTLGPDITIEAYDVDVTAGDDTSVAVLLPRFEPSRLIGSVTYAPKALKDTVKVPIDTAVLRAKIQAEPQFRRLRVGLRILASASAELRVFTTNNNGAPFLVFRPSLASDVSRYELQALSKTPNLPNISTDLADFQIVAVAPPPPPPNVLRIGGVPGVRGYLRFAIPPRIIDSSTIVRAQLLLTQRPNRQGAAAGDTGAVRPFAISAGGVLTDLRRALLFLAAGFDSTRVVPADSGVRTFEVIHIVRSWRGTTAERTPRAIALLANSEGSTAWQVDFFSSEAPAGVRPRLVVTYVPQPEPRVP